MKTLANTVSIVELWCLSSNRSVVMMDEGQDKNSSHRSPTMSSCSEPVRNQQIVADWLQRLQREGFAHSISSASLVEANGDEAELAIEVQEFLPEEEIIVIDAGNCKSAGISSK
jgi:hypothetical protein